MQHYGKGTHSITFIPLKWQLCTHTFTKMRTTASHDAASTSHIEKVILKRATALPRHIRLAEMKTGRISHARDRLKQE